MCDDMQLTIDELEATIHALRVELAAAKYQLHEQNSKLDTATLTIEVLRDDL